MSQAYKLGFFEGIIDNFSIDEFIKENKHQQEEIESIQKQHNKAFAIYTKLKSIFTKQ